MKATSFLISKKLAEIGFESETDLYLRKITSKKEPKIFNIQLFIDSGFFGGKASINHWGELNPQFIEAFPDDYEFSQAVKTYDLEILLDALPSKVFNFALDGMSCLVDSEPLPIIIIKKENESLADCAGRLIIKLYEQNLINFNK